MARNPQNPCTNGIVFVVASLYLVAQAGWRFLWTGHRRNWMG